MILIEVRDGWNKVIGRCDAKCYNADHDLCVCICEGNNHRKGLKAALEKTKQDGEGWLDEICKGNPVNRKVLLNENLEQLKLF